jgi:hypothetical protein
MLGHRSTYTPRGGTPTSICRIKSGESGRSLVAFHASDPVLYTLPLVAQAQDMNHYEQAHRILAEHVRQYVESYASAHTAPRKERKRPFVASADT